MENKTDGKITIAMTDRAPIRIDWLKWPVIACAVWHDGPGYSANVIARIHVRAHADGRRIVYGFKSPGPAAGYVLASEDAEIETIRAIRQVGRTVGAPGLADDCIADLPAEEI